MQRHAAALIRCVAGLGATEMVTSWTLNQNSSVKMKVNASLISEHPAKHICI